VGGTHAEDRRPDRGPAVFVIRWLCVEHYRSRRYG